MKEESGKTWTRGGSWLKAHHDQDTGCRRSSSRGARALQGLGGNVADRSQQRATEFSCDGPRRWFRGVSVFVFCNGAGQGEQGAHSCKRWPRGSGAWTGAAVEAAEEPAEARPCRCARKNWALGRGCAERVQIVGARHGDTLKPPQRKGATKVPAMTTQDCKCSGKSGQPTRPQGCGAERPNPPAQTTEVCKTKSVEPTPVEIERMADGVNSKSKHQVEKRERHRQCKNNHNPFLRLGDDEEEEYDVDEMCLSFVFLRFFTR